MSECKFSNDISETLLIPLYMRAKESRRGNDAIVHDPVAISSRRIILNLTHWQAVFT